MSYLQNKSCDLVKAANLLHREKLFSAVAHSAYYCCLQQIKHILLHSLHKTEDGLKQERIKLNKQANKGAAMGTHEFLINEIVMLIYAENKNDFRTFHNNIGKLKKLRVNADYDDAEFSEKKSSESLLLSSEI